MLTKEAVGKLQLLKKNLECIQDMENREYVTVTLYQIYTANVHLDEFTQEDEDKIHMLYEEVFEK